jgi:mevalonate pyrophosphate decarboxylase
MTVSSVKTGELSLSFALNNNFMEPIATTLVGSGGVNQITFNDIPQTYKHLQIRGIARSARSGETDDNIALQFNADTGSNYAHHDINGNGSSASAGAAISATSIRVAKVSAASATASVFGVCVFDILDYANTNKYKTTRSLNGFDSNGSGNAVLFSGLWQNTNAITSIKLFSQTGANNFAQYSRFSLYGIRG